MKKIILGLILPVAVMLGVTGAAMVPAYASPASDALTNVNNAGGSESGETNVMNLIKSVINAVLGLVGVAAVVMIIIGGINFITSQGDAGKVAKARNTILYGVIGMVIALMAFAIVNFVLTEVFNAGTN